MPFETILNIASAIIVTVVLNFSLCYVLFKIYSLIQLEKKLIRIQDKCKDFEETIALDMKMNKLKVKTKEFGLSKISMRSGDNESTLTSSSGSKVANSSIDSKLESRTNAMDSQKSNTKIGQTKSKAESIDKQTKSKIIDSKNSIISAN